MSRRRIGPIRRLFSKLIYHTLMLKYRFFYWLGLKKFIPKKVKEQIENSQQQEHRVTRQSKKRNKAKKRTYDNYDEDQEYYDFFKEYGRPEKKNKKRRKTYGY